MGNITEFLEKYEKSLDRSLKSFEKLCYDFNITVDQGLGFLDASYGVMHYIDDGQIIREF